MKYFIYSKERIASKYKNKEENTSPYFRFYTNRLHYKEMLKYYIFSALVQVLKLAFMRGKVCKR